MSTKYPVLDNRPIDQWKVSELKEELKRRKITTKGLKEDLIKRLNEAICNESESGNEADNGSDCDPEPQVECEDVDTKPTPDEVVGDIRDNGDNNIQKVEDEVEEVDIDDSAAKLGEGKVEDEEPRDDLDSDSAVREPAAAFAVSMEADITGSENTVTLLESKMQESQNSEIQIENEDTKAPQEDAVPDMRDPNNQVSEVSPVVGFQVKCESISTDSVSINEKNELKDNLNADNVHLELEVKPEMVEPSSNNVTNGDELYPLDGQEPRDNQSSIEDLNDSNGTNLNPSKKNDSVDAGSSEKLNLDRSSGDDSMEEDVLESKQIDSNHNFGEVGNMNEPTGVNIPKDEIPVADKAAILSSDKKDEVPAENKNSLTVPAEKRKLEVVDQEAFGNNEPPKRQRRWNSENLKVPERQTSNRTPSTTPRDAFQSTIPKRIFNRSDSTLSGDSPKERVVPPSPKPPTNSLRIDRFVRPFTLKAVQELLAKTGKVCSFWMDHIKTHCYVTYSSVEEAVETRNALYNLQWPSNGGRLLVVEFVDAQEVKIRTEAPQSPTVPVSTSPAAPPTQPPFQPPPSRQQVTRQQLPQSPQLPPPPPLSDPPAVRERLPLPPPPPLPKKPEPPIVTLDDLFRKTKAIPRIYYLPLSEEQVAEKLVSRGKNMNN